MRQDSLHYISLTTTTRCPGLHGEGRPGLRSSAESGNSRGAKGAGHSVGTMGPPATGGTRWLRRSCQPSRGWHGPGVGDGPARICERLEAKFPGPLGNRKQDQAKPDCGGAATATSVNHPETNGTVLDSTPQYLLLKTRFSRTRNAKDESHVWALWKTTMPRSGRN
jgi:hypothetical protein